MTGAASGLAVVAGALAGPAALTLLLCAVAPLAVAGACGCGLLTAAGAFCFALAVFFFGAAFFCAGASTTTGGSCVELPAGGAGVGGSGACALALDASNNKPPAAMAAVYAHKRIRVHRGPVHYRYKRALDADECMRRALFRIRRLNVYQKSMESARVWHFAREMCAGIAYLQRRQFIGRVQVSRARWRVGAST